VSVVPTTAPEGALTVERTPEDNNARPEPVARFRVFPAVPENKVTSLSTDVEVLVEASPPDEGEAHVASSLKNFVVPEVEPGSGTAPLA